MTHEHDHKQGGCCGGQNKGHEHSKPKKEKDSCCPDEKDKNPEKDKTESQGGCCGGGKK